MSDKLPTTSTVDTQEYITTKQVAEMLHREEQTIRKWISKGTYPKGFSLPAKIQNRNIWRKADVVAFIENQFSNYSMK